MPEVRETARPRGGRHILIVEDNPDGREALRLLLTLLGHKVEVAGDGIEGALKAVALRPEVMLVDIGLPGLDGLEVARRARAALGRSVLLLAYTAWDDPTTCRQVVEAGFDGHLVKPVALEELTPWLGPTTLRGQRRAPRSIH
jgi:CheY-like chemotaxis protein